jgi:hypothetical protein
VGVAEAEAVEERLTASVVEPLIAGEEDSADLIEGIAFCGLDARAVLAGPSTDVVQAPLGDVRSARSALPAFRLVGFSGPSPLHGWVRSEVPRD